MTLKNLIHMFHHAPAPPGEAGRHITSAERRKNKKLCQDDDSREYRHFFERMRGRNKLTVRGLRTVPLMNVSFGEVVSDSSDAPVIKCAVKNTRSNWTGQGDLAGVVRMYPAHCGLQNLTLENGCTRQMWHEACIWATISHPHIVAFLGMTYSREFPMPICEYYPEGSLYDANKSRAAEEIPRSGPLLLSWAAGLASAIAYLHTLPAPVIHRNIKSSNVMFAKHGTQVALSDFSTACVSNDDLTPAVGSLRWMAPEIANEQLYSELSDVYSFGMVLHEMVAAAVPFEQLTSTQACLTAMAGKRPSMPAHCPPWLATLAARCWDASPKSRPSSTKVHTYLRSLGSPARYASPTPSTPLSESESTATVHLTPTLDDSAAASQLASFSRRDAMPEGRRKERRLGGTIHTFTDVPV